MSEHEELPETVATLREWMMSVREKSGKLTPEIVLEAARPPDSPAHGFIFNLGVEEAAEAYYLDRAHRLIQTVKVTVVSKPKEEPRRVRFFHAVTSDEGERIYEPLPVVVQQVDKFAQVKAAALQRLKDAQSVLADLEFIAQEAPRKATILRARTAMQEVSDMVASA